MSAETFSPHLLHLKQSTCHSDELGRVLASSRSRKSQVVEVIDSQPPAIRRDTYPNATTMPPFSWSMTFLHPPQRASMSLTEDMVDMASPSLPGLAGLSPTGVPLTDPWCKAGCKWASVPFGVDKPLSGVSTAVMASR